MFRELPFKKGDIILVHKKINDDWYLGEHHGFCGLFPTNFVYFLNNKNDTRYDIKTLKNRLLAMEGIAKVKYDFVPQETVELELHKVKYH